MPGKYICTFYIFIYIKNSGSIGGFMLTSLFTLIFFAHLHTALRVEENMLDMN